MRRAGLCVAAQRAVRACKWSVLAGCLAAFLREAEDDGEGEQRGVVGCPVQSVRR